MFFRLYGYCCGWSWVWFAPINSISQPPAVTVRLVQEWCWGKYAHAHHSHTATPRSCMRLQRCALRLLAILQHTIKTTFLQSEVRGLISRSFLFFHYHVGSSTCAPGSWKMHGARWWLGVNNNLETYMTLESGKVCG